MEPFQDLPWLSQQDQESLNSDITLGELTAAVSWMALEKAPGIDDLLSYLFNICGLCLDKTFGCF